MIPLTGEANSAVDTVGILQMSWLLHDRREFQDVLAHIEEPSVDNLRKAGMFELRVGTTATEDAFNYNLPPLRRTSTFGSLG